MPNTRWYNSLLEGLPPESRRRLAHRLRRAVRSNCLPSRRAWQLTVQQVAFGYSARV